jgi:transposase
LQQLSTCSLAPFATVQRARILLLAHRHPQWQNATIAQQVGCHVNTGKQWRQRWQRSEALHDTPRAGTRRTFTALQRAQVVALACRAPRHYGKAWQRWSGEKLAQVAVEQHLVTAIAPSTIRRWLRADQMKPWRSHSWQHSTDPQFVEKAAPVLDLYAPAPVLPAQGELTTRLVESPAEAKRRGGPAKTARLQQAFAAHLRAIARASPATLGTPVLLTLENAPWHQGAGIAAVLAAHPQLPLSRLPSSSPHLNLIERFWRVLRRRATHNRLFETRAEVRTALRASFCYCHTMRHKVLSLVHSPRKQKQQS